MAGCAGKSESPLPDPVQANIPALPSDVRNCARNPVEVPRLPNGKKLREDQIEILWKTDRATLVKVNSCLERAVCQYLDVRKSIGGDEHEMVCASSRR